MAQHLFLFLFSCARQLWPILLPSSRLLLTKPTTPFVTAEASPLATARMTTCTYCPLPTPRHVLVSGVQLGLYCHLFSSRNLARTIGLLSRSVKCSFSFENQVSILSPIYRITTTIYRQTPAYILKRTSVPFDCRLDVCHASRSSRNVIGKRNICQCSHVWGNKTRQKFAIMAAVNRGCDKSGKGALQVAGPLIRAVSRQ